jgi:uncharacterized glyoxalase superfamily protein PhnB
MTIRGQAELPVIKMHHGFEVYPKPMFAAMATADVNVLAQWYQAALNFGIIFRAPDRDGQPMLVHLRCRKYQDVLIRPAALGAATAGAGSWSICFQADEDVDQLAARAAAVPIIGKACVEPPADTPWNTRQVRIIDPDGRALVFSQPRFDPELTRRMREAFEADSGAAP